MRPFLRVACFFRGHKWRPFYAEGTGALYARRSDGTDGHKFTFWTEKTGGRQVPALDGYRCKRCSSTREVSA